MTDLFNEDGHLTEYAFDALIQNLALDELSRLEISEHLSFCDVCVAKYAEALENRLLLAPEEPVAPGVIQRIRQRAVKIFFSKYTTVAAAASFAIIFWNIGVFQIDTSGESRMLNAMNQSMTSVSQRADDLVGKLSQSVQAFFDQFTFERGNN